MTAASLERMLIVLRRVFSKSQMLAFGRIRFEEGAGG
jgi:hypothetical protein